ncbi:AAA family ATPase [Lentibacter sp. XHP0401]|jgi:pilus assembly protein CpaE|uniref:AAA family ATPase n=1 Tax=Lentibacter sp. XHP0401 TaxID=2984334 RepID=UPI0021E71B51|nr:AAA family ATPase [Lentibacter sp. XHP0401]MCV2893054.1 AAA family ATPase [Lentibacter sp. XHP0401]
MTRSDTTPQELPPLKACTVSRDVQNFDLLIEDMESALGEAWGDLGFNEARHFFEQPEAEALEFVALALDAEDEDKVVFLSEIIKSAKAKGINVIVIAEDVTPASLHQLLRDGADEFVPYPLPEGELHAAIERLNAPAPAAPEAVAAPVPAAQGPGKRDGVIIACHGLAGGTGATTLAVNLAWELANADKKNPPKVCLIDLDLQFGSVATYLDLPRLEPVFELWTDTESMDDQSFKAALVGYEEQLSVFTAPSDMIPLDLITSTDVERVLDMAASHFDYVIVDMPKTLVQWSETVLRKAPVYFATLELDMRSAQNALRLVRALQAEELPAKKLRYVLNRGPKFTDLNGKARIKRMAESLEIKIEIILSDGGKPVTQGADHGLPLASSAAKNPLRKEIAKLAAELHALGQAEAEAA